MPLRNPVWEHTVVNALGETMTISAFPADSHDHPAVSIAITEPGGESASILLDEGVLRDDAARAWMEGCRLADGERPVTGQAATPGQPATEAADGDVQVRSVTLWLCDLCLDGAGGECHVPGCSLWMHRAPDTPVRDSQGVTVHGLAPIDVPGQPEADATDPFGGHEFAYESSTDLFRCTRCRRYEVTVREGEQVTQCPGDLPGEPMELNAY